MGALNSEIIRQELKGILSKDEYQLYYREEQNILSVWWKKLTEWLYELLMKHLPSHEAADTTTTFVSYGVAILIGLLLLLVLYYLYSSFIRVGGKYRHKPVVTEEEMALSPTRHMIEADRLVELGDIRNAFRHVFLAFVLYLNQNNWIEAKLWKTNWEYYEELYTYDPELAKSFYLIALKFDEAVYGGKMVTLEDYQSYRDQVNRSMQHQGKRNHGGTHQ